MFSSPSQILCNVFGLNIYYYGVLLALAICIGTLVSNYIGFKYYNLKKDLVIDLAPYLIIFGILGARLYYCMLDYDFYLRFPTEIIAIRHGGISIHGAILGGVFGLALFAKKHRISAIKLCDICAYGLPIGQAIGRWGNFFNSEAYGAPTNLPWKLYIAPQYRQIPYQNYEYYHPAFLYESILDILIFLVLIYLLKNNRLQKQGQNTLVYLILYSIVRIIVELCRLDSVMYICGIPVAICVSVGIIILSGLIFLRTLR